MADIRMIAAHFEAGLAELRAANARLDSLAAHAERQAAAAVASAGASPVPPPPPASTAPPGPGPYDRLTLGQRLAIARQREQRERDFRVLPASPGRGPGFSGFGARPVRKPGGFYAPPAVGRKTPR